MKNTSFENTIWRITNKDPVTVTFQVTNDCCCKCTYCYQINKGKKYMTSDIGIKIINLLFDLYEKDDKNLLINKDTPGIVLDFIGGEPLMNIKVIDKICDYFFIQALKKIPNWSLYSRINFSSNGALYRNDEIQNFFKKYKGMYSYSVTLDGPEEVHNKCRIYNDGTGNFKEAYDAFKDLSKESPPGTKITLSKDNLKDLSKIFQFFIKENSLQITGNVIFEENWTYEHATIFYNELIKCAEILLNNPEVESTFFEEDFFKPKLESDLQTWCGGSGKMLAFDPDGIAYPCLRYMESSLGKDQSPLIIGNCNEGIYNTPESIKVLENLKAINRRTKSTDECFYCPIASGCADCAGWNYQEFGTPNKRSVRICPMHKARSLANVYYWNKRYRQENSEKRFKIYLPKEEVLKIISEKEYNMLLNLSEN